MPSRLVTVGRGRYKVRWRDGTRHPVTGRLIEHSTKVLNLAAAKAEMRRLDADQVARRELKRGATGGRILTLVAILKLWKDSGTATGKITDTYAYDAGENLRGLFERRHWTTVADITPAAVDRWMQDRKGVGVAKVLRQLKTLLRFAAGVHRQPVDVQVLLTIPPFRPSRPKPRLLEQHELDWLLALGQVRGGDEPYWQLVHLATYGCRPIDTCWLDLGDFDPAEGTLTLRDLKNRTTVTHPLLPRDVERYRTHQAQRYRDGDKPDAPFFRDPRTLARWRVSKRGQATALRDWYTDNVSEWLMPKGLTGIYLLKDFAISAMDRNGIDDATKALFTGHLDLDSYQRYKASNLALARSVLRLLPGGGDAAGAAAT